MEPSPAPTHPDDLHLAQAALAGDPAARVAFCERMGCVPRIVTALDRRMGRLLSAEDLEDLAQDTLVTIWRRLHTYRGMAAMETWAYRFCYYELSNRLQTLRGKPHQYQVKPEDAIEEALHDCDEFEDVHQALDRLDSDTADLIRLKCFEQWKFAELAGRLGASSSTLKARYYRGLSRLRTYLSPGRETSPEPGREEVQR